jgi:hypothetical protein
MKDEFQIPEPLLFNVLKHHLGYIRSFIEKHSDNNAENNLLKELKHIGTTVMDVYSGSLAIRDICRETADYLSKHKLSNIEKFVAWTGNSAESFRIITLSDDSEWTMKFQNDHSRFAHIFPARNSVHTFRVRGNTLKSAVIYLILIGKDKITGDDLNKVRPMLGLSPVKDEIEAEAIVEMIEIIRG